MNLRVAALLAGRLNMRSRSGAGITAVVGVGLALAVMLVSVAVLKGFKKGIRERVTDFESAITIKQLPEGGEEASWGAEGAPFAVEPWMQRIIADAAPEAVISQSSQRPAMLKGKEELSGVMIKGGEFNEKGFPSTALVKGRMATDAGEIVISEATARALDVDTAGRLTACFFVENNGEAGQGREGMKARRLTVTGIYNSGFGEYDRKMAYSSPKLIAGIDKLPDGSATRLEINGIDDGDIDIVSSQLADALLQAYYTGESRARVFTVDDVHRSGAVYFSWLAMLDTNVAVILGLMAVVAAFTVVSSLFILVLENVSVIGLLKAEGARDSLIRLTFILLAQRLVGRGLLAGNIIGLGLIALQGLTHAIGLDASVYYMNYVPVAISVADILLLNAGMIVLAALVLILPSHIVATLSPATTLRYE